MLTKSISCPIFFIQYNILEWVFQNDFQKCLYVCVSVIFTSQDECALFLWMSVCMHTKLHAVKKNVMVLEICHHE